MSVHWLHTGVGQGFLHWCVYISRNYNMINNARSFKRTMDVFKNLYSSYISFHLKVSMIKRPLKSFLSRKFSSGEHCVRGTKMRVTSLIFLNVPLTLAFSLC